ncbi:zf-CCHC domain-containing protein/RVP_2 domain-containing protein [Cephalotus follicularis]|uniref:Zf-CCHC domain-containing protein/RVP_2 domain-containing protein n=1 Tax=Cephalotus follicularis TaxID=3775 RepID=A0A1Q3CC36_CEPFO|nr:zf-CCHC domain-containing protein/RVP_2 domain-containing protein [Cephalotus follicularis]
MTVAQYQTHFVELARHTPYLVEGESKKIRRFLKGLRPDIRSKLLLLQLTSFVDIAERARILEADANDRRTEQSRTQSRPASSRWQNSGSPNKSSKNKYGQTATLRTPSQGSYAETGACYHCGRKGHLQKDCWRFNGWCLRCGAPGHSVKDCPKGPTTAPIGPRSSSGAAAGPSQRRDNGKGIAKGRFFVLSQTKVPESTSVVGGTLYVYGYSARVLMDSGASHSFISAHFASCLGVTPDCLSYTLDVSTPTGTSMYTDLVYRSCEMSMADIPLYADLIVLPIRDFDVILGMDWLSAHRALMDCYHETVDFCLPDGTTFQFKGDKGFSTPIISFIRASRYLDRGCEGYLAYVIDRRKEKGLSLE